MVNLPDPSGGEWTVEEMADLLANPMYAGVAVPALVTEQQWIAAAEMGMREQGTKRFLARMLRVLRQHLGGEPLKG